MQSQVWITATAAFELWAACGSDFKWAVWLKRTSLGSCRAVSFRSSNKPRCGSSRARNLGQSDVLCFELGTENKFGGEQALLLILRDVGAIDDVRNKLRAEG